MIAVSSSFQLPNPYFSFSSQFYSLGSIFYAILHPNSLSLSRNKICKFLLLFLPSTTLIHVYTNMNTCTNIIIIPRIHNNTTILQTDSTTGVNGSEEQLSLSCFKKVAVVENFYDIIYNVHVEMDGRSGKHAGQKRTYRAVSTLLLPHSYYFGILSIPVSSSHPGSLCHHII